MRSPTLRSRLQASGIRRTGGPRNGFRYRCANGARAGAADLARIAALEIPPNWKQVVVASSLRPHLQAIGLDAAGRWQYLYRASHTAGRVRDKFERVSAFGAALPALRRALHRDLARKGLPREKAIAGALLLLAECAIRPGKATYARDNGSFGLATLRSTHVEIEGDLVRLRFRGKHGQPQRHELRSLRLARMIRAMKLLPGPELFKYRRANGRVWDLRDKHLNAYVKRTMGATFSARDFRTWAGTLICASALRREADARHVLPDYAITRAVRETASHLGNTPRVARESYVHPTVLEAFRQGRVVSYGLEQPDSFLEGDRAEANRSRRALLELLHETASRRDVHRRSRPATTECGHGRGAERSSVRKIANRI
ncbi:MAG: DNA topoisomerase IB [Planctomycetes bacterium]|nr:DNA topoisomerase IB [Planctomycetota bacterium]MBI3847208.1 DNA topoisomerase IB [Planctomycetota bacterium]